MYRRIELTNVRGASHEAMDNHNKGACMGHIYQKGISSLVMGNKYTTNTWRGYTRHGASTVVRMAKRRQNEEPDYYIPLEEPPKQPRPFLLIPDDSVVQVRLA